MSQAKHTKQTKKTNPHKPKRDAKSFIKFLLVAALLLLAIDYFFWKEERPYVAQIRENYYAEKQAEAEAARQKIESLLPPKVVYPEDGSDYFEAPSNLTSQIDGEAVQKTSTSDPKISVLRARPAEKMEEGKTNYDNIIIRRKKSDKPPKVLKEPSDKPDIKSEAPIIPSSSKPKIAIVIDDVGMNIAQSQRAISLPAQVTLALLPYANSVQQMAQQAKGSGHELIIHTPMEALSSDVPLGSMALMSDMDAEAFNNEFDRIANSFEGYSGVNNHMGSLLTQDEKAMGYLMDHLKKRGLYFLDSRTIHTSVAEDVAVFGALYTVAFHPVVFFVLLAVFVLLLVWLVPKIWRFIGQIFGNARHPSVAYAQTRAQQAGTATGVPKLDLSGAGGGSLPPTNNPKLPHE